MADPLQVLDIVAHNQRHDPELLRKLVLVSKDTHASAVNARRLAFFEDRAIELVQDPFVAHWVDTPETVREFVSMALARDPVRDFHREDKNKISQESFKGGAITARSLLLGRFTAISDMLYGADNYRVCLGLSVDELRSLSGKTLLDVGCGNAIFPAEALSLFNIKVQGIDLNAKDDPQLKYNHFSQYVKNLVFTKYLAQVRNLEAPCAIGQGPLVDLCLQNVNKTFEYYMSGELDTGNATRLPYGDNQFDGALCSWLLLYLPIQDSIQALKEMVRVTKRGGLIRICQGFQIQQDSNTGLPVDLKDVKGIRELDVDQRERNPGGLRIFKVTK